MLVCLPRFTNIIHILNETINVIKIHTVIIFHEMNHMNIHIVSRQNIDDEKHIHIISSISIASAYNLWPIAYTKCYQTWSIKYEEKTKMRETRTN